METKFIKFLEENDLLNDFEINLGRSKGLTIEEFLPTVEPIQYVSEAFIWSKVRPDTNAWRVLNKKWQDYLIQSNGIGMIAKEREEQINKHGFTIEKDIEAYQKDELESLALFCINPDKFLYPHEMSPEYASKIRVKNRIDQLVTAGALIAAQIDLLLKKERDNGINC